MTNNTEARVSQRARDAENIWIEISHLVRTYYRQAVIDLIEQHLPSPTLANEDRVVQARELLAKRAVPEIKTFDATGRLTNADIEHFTDWESAYAAGVAVGWNEAVEAATSSFEDGMMEIPFEGEQWEHTKTGLQYVIEGLVWNTITDCLDVSYRPLYDCEFERFTRQLRDHSKAFISKNDDGTPRFLRIAI